MSNFKKVQPFAGLWFWTDFAGIELIEFLFVPKKTGRIFNPACVEVLIFWMACFRRRSVCLPLKKQGYLDITL